MHQLLAKLGHSSSERGGRLATWMPEGVVVGASLTVVAMAVGVVSAGPAAVLVAGFAGAALWLNMDDGAELD